MRSLPVRYGLVCLSLLARWTAVTSLCNEPTRLRRAWHDLDTTDQMLFVNGFQELRRSGQMTKFRAAHAKGTEAEYMHSTQQNFFWHSYWLFEIESAIRNLGAENECFTLPYWDITHDAAWWGNEEDPDIHDLRIYNSNLGGEGNSDDYCVVDWPWSIDEYSVDTLCADDEDDAKHCCLKRWHSSDYVLPAPPAFIEQVFHDKSCADFETFMEVLNTLHGDVHNFIGSVQGTHFYTSAGDSTADPLFVLFHNFVDLIRLLHEDCWELDTVPLMKLQDKMPLSYQCGDECQALGHGLDDAIDFSALCTPETLCHDMDITPRMMFDISPNTQFGVMFDLGDYWNLH